jgi:capsular exopolysaccharide synthesis family protein
MLGVAVVVTQARTDSSVQEPGDAGLLLGVPELGVIPNASKMRKVSAPVLSVFPAGNDREETGMIVSQANPSAVADSFRAVLASIIFSGGAERQRVLVVTSAGPGEGKTTTVTNLAVALAKMNRKVLLIDGDLRNPRIHEIFGVDNSMGVTDLLDQVPSDHTAIDPLIQSTAFPNLYVLPSGPTAKIDSTDVLFSMSMPSLIARCRAQFDMVLIDTPPVMLLPDARLLGRMADAAVLIARAGHTTRGSIKATFQRLVQDHIPVLGIVLNDWNAKASPYYSSYYGSYSRAAAAPPIARPS